MFVAGPRSDDADDGGCMSADDDGTEERKLAVARALSEKQQLTKAQTGVLRLVAVGANRYEIAEETGTSVRTVKNHLEAIFDKLERVVGARSSRGIENWILDQALYDAVTAKPSEDGQGNGEDDDEDEEP